MSSMVNIQRVVSRDFLIELGDSDDGLILDSLISKPRNHKHADDGTPTFNRSEYKILAGGSDGRLRSKIACELIFLPNFYCELKELGFTATLRCCCALMFDDLQRMFPETLVSVLQHFFRELQDLGLGGCQAIV